MRKIVQLLSDVWLKIGAVVAFLLTIFPEKVLAVADVTPSEIGINNAISTDVQGFSHTLIRWGGIIVIAISGAAGSYFMLTGLMQLAKSGENPHASQGVGKKLLAGAGLLGLTVLLGVIYYSIQQAGTGAGTVH